MAKTEDSKKKKSGSTPEGGDIHVGGNVAGDNNVIGNNNVVNNYVTVVEKNTKPNDPDYWNLKHPYPMPPNFTGRLDERAMLTQWLDDDSENRLFILRALGGFGKSALAWQWLTHDVNPETWKKVVFWSFYEGDASFEHFVEETLKYLNLEVQQGKRNQVDTLLQATKSQKILLIMDGFERALRAYSSMSAAYQGDESTSTIENNSQLDCINLNAEFFLKSVCSLPNIKSKVLMTTRLTPRTVKPHGELMLGCREIELTSMQPSDAVEFFYKQKIKGTKGQIESACEVYGYHPLSLRLLVGRILRDLKNPSDILVTRKINIDEDIKQRQHHILDISYKVLSLPEKSLINIIACFRSTIHYSEFETVLISDSQDKNPLYTKTPLSIDALQKELMNLLDSGLLLYDYHSKTLDLHPIVRKYVISKVNQKTKIQIHNLLQKHYNKMPKSSNIKTIQDLKTTIELYYHTVKAQKYSTAGFLFLTNLKTPLFYQFGEYRTCIEVLQEFFLLDKELPPKFVIWSMKAVLLNDLANSFCFNGEPQKSISTYKRAMRLFALVLNLKSYAISSIALGCAAYTPLGFLKKAHKKIQNNIILGSLTMNTFRLSRGHHELGRLSAIYGLWDKAENHFNEAQSYLEVSEPTSTESSLYAYKSFYEILRFRSHNKTTGQNHKFLENAELALKKALKFSKLAYPIERDFIHAYWLLGNSYRLLKNLTLADKHLSNALARCRNNNTVEVEANILLELAYLRYDQKRYEETKSLAEEALLITERSGYVLQGADVNLFLAQYALEQEKDKAKAKVYAEEAKKLATCDGPPYYYKVAYEEAEAMLEKLK